MLKPMSHLAAVLAMAVLAVGCGKLASPSAGKPDGSTAGQAAAKNGGPDASTPEQVVEKFVTAFRDGHRSTAESLFTQKAREAVEKHGLAIDPAGSPGSKFLIKGSQKRSDSETLVQVVWIDSDAAGGEQSYNVAWITRRDPEGWRIAGLVAELGPGEPPRLLDFENPAEMLASRQAASDDLARRQATAARTQATAETARNPGPSAKR